MGRRSNINSIFIATASFIGGVAAGLLLAPKAGSQNRKWISDNAGELARWAERQGQSAKNKSSRQLRNLRKNVQQGISRNVPDLYEATEDIELGDNEILSE